MEKSLVAIYLEAFSQGTSLPEFGYERFNVSSKSLLAITIASENAGTRPEVRGTGTFLSALIDEMANITPEIILQKAKLDVVS